MALTAEGLSTATGWEPVAGQLVIERMWSPMHPTWEASLEERQQSGRRYGEDKVMRLVTTTPDHDAHEYARSVGRDLPPRIVTRWMLADPERPNAEHLWSVIDSDWAELLPTEDEQVVEVPLW